jgi:hypothetical protein
MKSGSVASADCVADDGHEALRRRVPVAVQGPFVVVEEERAQAVASGGQLRGDGASRGVGGEDVEVPAGDEGRQAHDVEEVEDAGR